MAYKIRTNGYKIYNDANASSASQFTYSQTTPSFTPYIGSSNATFKVEYTISGDLNNIAISSFSRDMEKLFSNAGNIWVTISVKNNKSYPIIVNFSGDIWSYNNYEGDEYSILYRFISAPLIILPGVTFTMDFDVFSGFGTNIILGLVSTPVTVPCASKFLSTFNYTPTEPLTVNSSMKLRGDYKPILINTSKIVSQSEGYIFDNYSSVNPFTEFSDISKNTTSVYYEFSSCRIDSNNTNLTNTILTKQPSFPFVATLHGAVDIIYLWQYLRPYNANYNTYQLGKRFIKLRISNTSDGVLATSTIYDSNGNISSDPNPYSGPNYGTFTLFFPVINMNDGHLGSMYLADAIN